MGKASRRKKERKAEDGGSKWEFMERVVELLERSITPDAKVERGQWLPSLLTGHPAQIDVAIRRGAPPRDTLTIVEVQKRGKKVEIGDFRGWLGKRDEVGAQHLICVSEAGFPESIVDLAKTQGARVRLLTLSELKGETWPVQIVDKEMRLVEVGYELMGVEPLKAGVIVLPESFEIRKEDPIFTRTGEAKRLSAMDLAKEAVGSQPQFQFKAPGDYNETLTYRPPSGVELSILLGGKPIALAALVCSIKLHIKRYRMPLTCSGYEQVDYKGALAYAITGAGAIDGRNARASLIFVPEESGVMRVADFVVDGFPPEALRISFSRIDPWPTS